MIVEGGGLHESYLIPARGGGYGRSRDEKEDSSVFYRVQSTAGAVTGVVAAEEVSSLLTFIKGY